jgi:hypothetical protein
MTVRDGLDDERCPFFWWAKSARHGIAHAGWPILWTRRPDQPRLHRYAGDPTALDEVFRRQWSHGYEPPPALSEWPQNAGEGEV